MPNDDLISKRELRKTFAELCPGDCSSCDYSSATNGKLFCAIIEDSPVIDAEPVRHATWSKNISGEFVFCSACHDSSFMGDCFAFPNRPEITIWRYCPHCGAKMKKEE